jgi:hypothetical protein
MGAGGEGPAKPASGNFYRAPPVFSFMRTLGDRRLALTGVLWRPLLCLALLLGLLLILAVALSTPYSWYRPRMPPRSYRSTPLADVMADLERNEVIPPGTQWTAPDLRERAVTVELWDLAPDREALSRVARAAGVSIAFPAGIHGDILGPVRVFSDPSLPPGISPEWHGFRLSGGQ